MFKEKILSEIRRTALENGGAPLGIKQFAKETGISQSDWYGKYWARWGDAQLEAGLQPNELIVARTDDDLLGNLAALARELGHYPVEGEIKLKARKEPGFPWPQTLGRLGAKDVLAHRLKQFCEARGDADVASYCDEVLDQGKIKGESRGLENLVSLNVGYVYLVRHGGRREYKIGRTKNPIRREGEIRTELPEQLQPVHQIMTDDPAGIESYWHTRFAAKRKNGEWFALSIKDVQAFKRWKKIH